jgi:polyisoprenoid-binding protein YceI
MKLIRTSLALALILACSSAWAEWKLIPDKSQLSFVSTKKEHVAESHTFKTLQGSVDDAGNGKLIVGLASVDTKVAIRDERMREFLFQTNVYPTAVYTVALGATKVGLISAWQPGEQGTMVLEGELDLHGVKHPVSADVIVTKAGVDRVLVASTRPVIIRAQDFGLVQGINKLAELVKLSSISYAVPVTFVLTFDVITP